MKLHFESGGIGDVLQFAVDEALAAHG